jgi:S1/P1 Nuclease
VEIRNSFKPRASASPKSRRSSRQKRSAASLRRQSLRIEHRQRDGISEPASGPADLPSGIAGRCHRQAKVAKGREPSPSPDGHANNLHAFWDSTVVNALGSSADDIAAKLDAQITPAEIKAWNAGTTRDWALEGFMLAKRDAYALPDRPTCDDHRSVALSPAYIATAQRDAAIQLKKAGIRLAWILNRSL